MSDWQPVYDDNRDGSDNGRGVESLVNHLDAAQDAAEAKRRFDYVVARLTRSQHELFVLMAAGWSIEQIMAEYAISRSTCNERIRTLLKKVEKISAKSRSHPHFWGT